MVNEENIIHHERMNSKKISLLNGISFLLGFSSAVGSFVFSSYFQQAFHRDNVGLFYFIAFVITQFILFNLHKIVGKFGKSQILKYFLLLNMILTMILWVVPVTLFGTGLLIASIIVSSLCWVACDIMLECFSVDRMSGRIRGLNLTISNLGFLLGPFISTRLLSGNDFSWIFFAQTVLNVIIFGMAWLGLRGFADDTRARATSIVMMLRKIVGRKNVVRIYWLSFVLNFFYALMVIYSPLYLRQLGMSWGNIGIVFTVMLIPFVILQYPVGVIADRRLGEKELIITSLSIMAPSVLSIYFIDNTGVIIWSIILFITRVGAAMLEVLTDSYFYKRIDGDDVEIIDFFRTARSAAYIVASVLSAFILLFAPIKAVFLLVFASIIIGMYPAFRLADNKSEAELKKQKAR